MKAQVSRAMSQGDFPSPLSMKAAGALPSGDDDVLEETLSTFCSEIFIPAFDVVQFTKLGSTCRANCYHSGQIRLVERKSGKR